MAGCKLRRIMSGPSISFRRRERPASIDSVNFGAKKLLFFQLLVSISAGWWDLCSGHPSSTVHLLRPLIRFISQLEGTRRYVNNTLIWLIWITWKQKCRVLDVLHLTDYCRLFVYFCNFCVLFRKKKYTKVS